MNEHDNKGFSEEKCLRCGWVMGHPPLNCNNDTPHLFPSQGRLDLFGLGPFTLPSGRVTHFKIECDALGEGDWHALARLGVELLPPFGSVEGVPRGGLAFAEALEPYATEGPLLIADDVWVTGLSMERHRRDREAVGIVAFARNGVSPWVRSILYLGAMAELSTYNAGIWAPGQRAG